MEIERAMAEVRTIFEAALRAVEPRALVRDALQLDSEALVVAETPFQLGESARLIVIAIGKAAVGMARGAADALGPRITGGLAVTKRGTLQHIDEHERPQRVSILEASHPVPDGSSLEAGQRVLAAVRALQPDDLVLALISGGGSALVEAPVDGVTLDDFANTTRLLLQGGADIETLNAVRRRISRIKAGGLARAIAPARVINLIVSDVLGNPLPVIASGPTVDIGGKSHDPAAAMRSLGLWDRIPESVREVLTSPSDTQADHVANVAGSVILADAERAARAAAGYVPALGYRPVVLGTRFEGEAREFARFWTEVARWTSESDALVGGPICIIGAGEQTVTVRGDGAGGRNTEMALAAALEIEGRGGVAIASLATDGDDGTSGAAGGVVVGSSARRARAAGLDPHALLDVNDSARFLAATGGLLRTGPTGTNVNDLYLALVS